MAKEIYLVRHGLTESNKKKIYAGNSDESLSPEAIDDISELGKRLALFSIRKIYSSPITRTFETARIIDSILGAGIEVEEFLGEMQLGPWEGLSEEEVALKYPEEWKLWNSKPSGLKMQGRETLEELRTRALRGLQKITKPSDSSRILVVTHVALIRVLMIHYNKMDMDDYRKLDVPNTSVFLLNHGNNNKRLLRIYL